MAERSYDYRAKNAVRKAWHLLLSRDLSQQHGLYLPAPQNLELPGYLERGADPSKLVGVERDAGLLEAVQRNAQGVTIISGDVRDAITHIEDEGLVPLDFVNLDFDGNFHTYTEDLLAVARVFPGSVGHLAVTSFGARDRGALIQGTINTSKIYSGLAKASAFIRGHGHMLKRYDQLVRLIPGGESTALAHFQRELGLFWWIVFMFAATTPRGDGLSEIDDEFVRSTEEILRAIRANVEKRLEGIDSDTELVFSLDTRLRDQMQNRQVAVWPVHMERYAYWSANRQPMRTWLFRFERLDGEGSSRSAQEFLQQIWAFAEMNPIHYVDEDGDMTAIMPGRGAR